MADHFYIGQPVPITWYEFTDPITDAPITDATVTGSLLDAAGATIAASSFSLPYRETKPKGAVYRGVTPIMNLARNTQVTLELVAVKSGQVIGLRRIPCVAAFQAKV